MQAHPKLRSWGELKFTSHSPWRTHAKPRCGANMKSGPCVFVMWCGVNTGISNQVWGKHLSLKQASLRCRAVCTCAFPSRCLCGMRASWWPRDAWATGPCV